MNETLYRWTFKFHNVVRQQNSGVVEDFIVSYFAVYLRIQKWKNYWNRSTFAKVIVKIKVAPFYGPRCIEDITSHKDWLRLSVASGKIDSRLDNNQLATGFKEKNSDTKPPYCTRAKVACHLAQLFFTVMLMKFLMKTKLFLPDRRKIILALRSTSFPKTF